MIAGFQNLFGRISRKSLATIGLVTLVGIGVLIVLRRRKHSPAKIKEDSSSEVTPKNLFSPKMKSI
jgi:LPXTG-motif cell wall-anchored protein